NIELIGCGPRSELIAPPAPGEFNPALPAIHALDTSGLRIEGLQVVAGWGGIAILLEADAGAGTVDPDGTFFTPDLENVHVVECFVQASLGSGIEVRNGHDIEIRANEVRVNDEANAWSAITVASKDVRIERNLVTVPAKRDKEYSALGGIWLRGG